MTSAVGRLGRYCGTIIRQYPQVFDFSCRTFSGVGAFLIAFQSKLTQCSIPERALVTGELCSAVPIGSQMKRARWSQVFRMGITHCTPVVGRRKGVLKNRLICLWKRIHARSFVSLSSAWNFPTCHGELATRADRSHCLHR